jgi:hypothetical protein
MHIAGYIGIAVDVTERRTAEEALYEFSLDLEKQTYNTDISMLHSIHGDSGEFSSPTEFMTATEIVA